MPTSRACPSVRRIRRIHIALLTTLLPAWAGPARAETLVVTEVRLETISIHADGDPSAVSAATSSSLPS